jgi:hypothetical protein
MVIVCYASLPTNIKNSNFRAKVCSVNGWLFPLLSRKRTTFKGRNFTISKCVNAGNSMLILPFGFNTVKAGSRMFFYNTIHRKKTIKLGITGSGKVRKVLQIFVFNVVSYDGAM